MFTSQSLSTHERNVAANNVDKRTEIASRSCVAYTIGLHWMMQMSGNIISYDREATSVVFALPSVVRTQVERRQSCVSYGGALTLL